MKNKTAKNTMLKWYYVSIAVILIIVALIVYEYTTRNESRTELVQQGGLVQNPDVNILPQKDTEKYYALLSPTEKKQSDDIVQKVILIRMQGSWQSDQDSNTRIFIQGNKETNFSDGVEYDTYIFKIIKDNNTGIWEKRFDIDDVPYKLLVLSSTKMTTTHSDTDGVTQTESYTKIK